MAELAHFSAPIPMVMVSLAGGPKHGYAVMEDVKAISRVALSSATVYSALERLERLGLAEALPAEGGRRLRHPYRLTRLGRVALRLHLAGVRQFVDEGQRRLVQPGWDMSAERIQAVTATVGR